MMLYTFYGDDFTGSTDVLETLAEGGVAAVLFLALPTAADLAHFPEAQAIGIAGDSRSRSPEWMSANLPDIFRSLKGFGARITHYKTCSTFDSAPQTGSIGRALELGIAAFPSRFVPIVVGAPHLGRFVLFANLFASADGTVERIDRHPTMSRHPVTPMLEADLRRHLRAQTELDVASLDLRRLTRQGLEQLLEPAPDAVLFDTFDEASLEAVGELIWQEGERGPLLAVGSSGLTQALLRAWRAAGMLPSAPAPEPADPAEQILVLSGSCSPVTKAQIEWAAGRGFEAIEIAPGELIGDFASLLERTLGAVRAGLSPVLYTALGPLPPRMTACGDELGAALGRLLRETLERTPIRRTVLCGGDTSSHALQQLPLRALTWVAPLTPGAPLCRAHAPGTSLDGREFVLKGGQIGPVDFFEAVRRGGRV